jgi:hypothetical protein
MDTLICQGSSRLQPLSNILESYQKISYDFCRQYYHYWDNNFPYIGNLFSDNIKITFLDKHLRNISQLVECAMTDGIWKFSHGNIYGISQPLDDNTILINTYGTISINDTLHYKKFSETIVIRQNLYCNWYITNIIFHLIPDV